MKHETDNLAETAMIINHPELLLPDRPIAFNRDFVKLGIGITGALMLSQAIYWSNRTKNKRGEFYKVQAEWEEETGLTLAEQRTALIKLKNKGFLIVEKKGIPAKNYFIVDKKLIIVSLVALNQHHWRSEINTTGGVKSTPHSYTETTTETTQEQNFTNFDRSHSLIDKNKDKKGSGGEPEPEEELKYEEVDSDGYPTKKPEKPKKNKKGTLNNKKAWELLNTYNLKFKYVTGKDPVIDKVDYFNAIRILKKLNKEKIMSIMDWYISYDNSKFKEHPSFKSIFTIENINKFNLH